MKRKDRERASLPKGGVLFIFADGTAYNTQERSIIARYFEEMAATEIDIQPGEKDVLRARLVKGKKAQEDKKATPVPNYYKLYLPGPGSVSNEEYKRPGKYSSVLSADKRKVKPAVKKIIQENRGKHRDKYKKLRKLIFLRKARLKKKKFPSQHPEVKSEIALPQKALERRTPVFGNNLSLAYHFYGANFPRIDGPITRAISGAALGQGREENVIKASTIVANTSFEKIVIVGWSRGAATGIHIANQLNELGLNTPEYLFLIDPVAGLDDGLTDENVRRIPKNVTRCVTLLAMGEQRKLFQPQDRNRIKPITNPKNVVFLPVHGKHSQVADAHESIDASAQITEHLLREFITEIAGEKKTEELLQDIRPLVVEEDSKISKSEAQGKELIKLYAHTQVFLKDYQKKAGLSLFYGPRPFTDQLETYTNEHTIFVNENHRELFNKFYPEEYNAIKKKRIEPESVWEWDIDINSKKVIISAAFLKDLDKEICNVPDDSIHKSYKHSLLDLRRTAQKKIFETLGNKSHNVGFPKKKLSELPELAECKRAVDMNKVLMGRADNSEKWKAIETFSNTGHLSLKKIVAKIVACAAGILVGMVVGAVLLIPLSPLGLAGLRIGKRAGISVHNRIFINSRCAREARNMMDNREEQRKLVPYLT